MSCSVVFAVSMMIGIGRRLAQHPAHFQSADARQHQVEHDQIGRERLHQLQRLRAVERGRGRVAGVRQIAIERLADFRIVIDDEDAPHPPIVRGVVKFS